MIRARATNGVFRIAQWGGSGRIDVRAHLRERASFQIVSFSNEIQSHFCFDLSIILDFFATPSRRRGTRQSARLADGTVREPHRSIRSSDRRLARDVALNLQIGLAGDITCRYNTRIFSNTPPPARRWRSYARQRPYPPSERRPGDIIAGRRTPGILEPTDRSTKRRHPCGRRTSRRPAAGSQQPRRPAASAAAGSRWKPVRVRSHIKSSSRRLSAMCMLLFFPNLNKRGGRSPACQPPERASVIGEHEHPRQSAQSSHIHFKRKNTIIKASWVRFGSVRLG